MDEALKKLEDLFKEADKYGRRLRFKAAPVCFVAAAVPMVWLLTRACCSTQGFDLGAAVARSTSAVLLSAIFLALGHRLMSISMAYGLRAGQLEDMILMLSARKEDPALGERVLVALVILRRAAMTHVVAKGAFTEEVRCLTNLLAQFLGNPASKPSKKDED